MDAVDKFLSYLRLERNYSELTVKGYGKDLRGFEAYLKDIDSQLSLATADADVIRRWMESMMDKGHTATSIQRRLSALRSFYRFALSRGVRDDNPARDVRAPKKAKPLPKFVKDREMDLLLDEMLPPEKAEGDYKVSLARTLFILLYETGMRRSELINLNDSDIHLERGEIRVTGKRNKQRLIPMGDELREAIEGYRCHRDKLPSRDIMPLLVSAKGLRLTEGQVRYIVELGLGQVTTMKKKSPHVLRHTFATSMLNGGAGIEAVRKLLGHETVATTEIYTHTTFEQLRKEYERAHPRA